MTELFVQTPTLTFDRPKLAALEVDENSEMWPRQILSELYKQLPDIADYSPEVFFQQTDPEQGYALGGVILSNTTDSALAVARPSTNPPKAVVPVIIKSHKLLPLDLIVLRNGKMAPLTAERLREALFRPDTFEMVTHDHGDASLWNMFYPPGRSDNQYGGGMTQNFGGGSGGITTIQGSGMKMSMLEEVVAPSALASDIQELVLKLAGDEVLRCALLGSTPASAGLRTLAEAEKTATTYGAAEDMLQKAANFAPSTVIQFGGEGGRYWVKRASADAFFRNAPVELDRKQLLKIAGEEITKRVDTDGTVTVTPNAVVSTDVDPESSKWKIVEEPGIYKVKSRAGGSELTGWVLPNLIDFDGVRVPMTVFTNGSVAMVQDQIVGARVAIAIDLPSGPAKGAGLFYVAGQGGLEATVPLIVDGSEAGMDGGDSFLVRKLEGGDARVRLVKGLLTIQALKGDIFMPSSAKFLPLNRESALPLASKLDELSSTAAEVKQAHIRLVHDGDDSFAPTWINLPKLASIYGDHRLTTDDAVFALSAAGMPAAQAVQKVAQAARQGSVKVSGVKDVRAALELVQEARQKVAGDSQAVRALRCDLMKEAAVLPDVMTVDAVMSLNFVNSENVRMFVQRLPYLEKALSMTCELVLGSRLGLTEIPEGASARAARGLNDTIIGLRALSLRDLDTMEQKTT